MCVFFSVSLFKAESTGKLNQLQKQLADAANKLKTFEAKLAEQEKNKSVPNTFVVGFVWVWL
jgi:hypothetical protein